MSRNIYFATRVGHLVKALPFYDPNQMTRIDPNKIGVPLGHGRPVSKTRLIDRVVRDGIDFSRRLATLQDRGLYRHEAPLFRELQRSINDSIDQLMQNLNADPEEPI